jgi:hypothetical protein
MSIGGLKKYPTDTSERRLKQYFGIGMRKYRFVSREQTLYHKKPQRKER